MSAGETVAGRYRVSRRVGRGGMAEVWQAHDDVLGREVALKLFDATGDDVDSRRAVGEMRVLAGLSHPNLVTVFDAGRDGDRTFLVMELVTGSTLADRIDAPGGLAEATVRAVGEQVAAGLAYIHARGIVHRDVKPANILLPERDHVDASHAKLADFGIAQHAGQERLTQTGMTVGTARFLAPEQVTGRPIGPAADVYALGIVLLDALGAGPGWNGTPVEVALARLAAPPPVPAHLGPQWVALLTDMTATDPAARPDATRVRARLVETAGTARAADAAAGDTAVAPAATRVLERPPAPTQVLRAGPATAAAAAAPRRRRARVLLAAVASLAAVVTAVVFAVTAGSSDPAPPTGDPTAATPTGSSVPPGPATTGPVAATSSAAAGATTTSAPSADPGGPGGTPPGQVDETGGKPDDKPKDKPEKPEKSKGGGGPGR